MLMPGLFTVSNIRYHPRLTSTDKKIKLWYMHIIEFHPFVKTGDTLLTVAENGRKESLS